MSRKVLSQTYSRRALRRTVWVVAGLLATGTVVISCRSTGTPSGEMDRYRDALARTAGVRTSDDGAINTGIDQFVALFSDFRPDPVHSAGLALYADDAHFDDGFAELGSNVAIAEYLRRSANHVDGLDVVIADTIIRDGEVYVRWEMHFKGSGEGVVTDVPGISHLRFDSASKIIYHRDHWDASGALADRIPALGKILRWVKAQI